MSAEHEAGAVEIEVEFAAVEALAVAVEFAVQKVLAVVAVVEFLAASVIAVEVVEVEIQVVQFVEAKAAEMI